MYTTQYYHVVWWYVFVAWTQFSDSYSIHNTITWSIHLSCTTDMVI